MQARKLWASGLRWRVRKTKKIYAALKNFVSRSKIVPTRMHFLHDCSERANNILNHDAGTSQLKTIRESYGSSFLLGHWFRNSQICWMIRRNSGLFCCCFVCAPSFPRARIFCKRFLTKKMSRICFPLVNVHGMRLRGCFNCWRSETMLSHDNLNLYLIELTHLFKYIRDKLRNLCRPKQ